jgi:hypothetical protein
MLMKAWASKLSPPLILDAVADRDRERDDLGGSVLATSDDDNDGEEEVVISRRGGSPSSDFDIFADLVGKEPYTPIPEKYPPCPKNPFT